MFLLKVSGNFSFNYLIFRIGVEFILYDRNALFTIFNNQPFFLRTDLQSPVPN